MDLGLSNVQIDNYLRSKLKNLQFIPSQSYESFFSKTGGIKQHLDSTKNYCVVLNMDREAGPGNHWVALILYPSLKLAFFYDSLLPNAQYQPGENLRNFSIRAQMDGWNIIENEAVDQENFFRGQENVMCGAYASAICLMMDSLSRPGMVDQKKLTKSFFGSHTFLKDPKKVQSVYRDIHVP